MLILASASPRRADILRELGVAFRVVVAEIEEILLADDPLSTAQRNAGRKLQWVRTRYPREWVMAADTVIDFRGRCMGKPASRAEAVAFLQQFSGRRQTVLTSVAMGGPGVETREETVASSVRFRTLDDGQIEEYFRRVDPLDKAGGYDINQSGELIIDSFSGSWTNIMGLPHETVQRWLHDGELGPVDRSDA